MAIPAPVSAFTFSSSVGSHAACGCSSKKSSDSNRRSTTASFRLRRREPRTGRNPRTGDRVDVAVETGRLLQARQGAEGADQPGAGISRRHRCLHRSASNHTLPPSAPVFVGRLPRTRVDSFCERRFKVLSASSAPRRLQTGYGCGQCGQPEGVADLVNDQPASRIRSGVCFDSSTMNSASSTLRTLARHSPFGFWLKSASNRSASAGNWSCHSSHQPGFRM